MSNEAMEFVEQANRNVLPLFSNLPTSYLQRKFFREQFSLVVSFHTKNQVLVWNECKDIFGIQEPILVALGIKRVWRTNHTRRKIVTVKREFYYIPIKDSLNMSGHVILKLP